jgi:DNA polymerase sigma
MGMNNFLAIRNSALIRAYMSIDARARVLGYIIKYWSRNRKINDPYRGTLSSYCYILLLIHFLQTRKPPVLPCLQTLNRKRDEVDMVNGFDCWFAKNIQSTDFAPQNKSTIAELLTDFFKYFAHEFQYRQSVVSVRLGSIYPKTDAKWEESGKKDFNHFLIEDPFQTSHNLGRVCTKDALFTIRGEIMRGYKIMNGERSIEELCREYIDEDE